MRTLMTVIAFCCVLTIAAGAQSTGQGTRVVWGVSFDQDFSCVYTPPPRNAHAVFFVGEPIRLKVVLINDLPAPVSFSAREQAPGRLVVVSSPLPDAVESLALERPKVAVLRRPGMQIESSWDQAITLQPADRLEWSVGLSRAGGMVPGRYEVNIVPDLSPAETQRLAVGVAPVIFEVREPRGFAASIEVLRRRAMWHYVDEEYALADQTFDDLLRLYPQSYIAHVMKGNIARRQGQRDRAFASYNTALGLLESGADRLFLTERRPSPQELDEDRANVRGMMRSVQPPRR